MARIPRSISGVVVQVPSRERYDAPATSTHWPRWSVSKRPRGISATKLSQILIGTILAAFATYADAVGSGRQSKTLTTMPNDTVAQGAIARHTHAASDPFPHIDDDDLVATAIDVEPQTLLSSNSLSAHRRLLRREVLDSKGVGDDGPGDLEEFDNFTTPQIAPSNADRPLHAPAQQYSSDQPAASNEEASQTNASSVLPSVWMPLARAAGWAPLHESTGWMHHQGMGYHRMPGAGAARHFSGNNPPFNLDLPQAKGIEHDGIIRIKVASGGDTTLELMTREENAKCLLVKPVFECMYDHGSYGINRLFTESWNDIIDMGWEQASWMDNPNVQRKRLFDLTLPMSRSSAAYDVAGSGYLVGQSVTASVVSQTLDIYQQLNLGVRALDVPIAVKIADNQLWATWGIPNILLTRVLKDIRQFLEENKHEVVILSARHATLLDDNVATIAHELLTPAAGVLPAEEIHMQVGRYLGEWLGIYENLVRLSEPRHNPVIQDMVSSQVRVMYFWEGQQVLCLNYTQCTLTPGWEQPSGLYSRFAFGQPYPIGTRPPGAGRRMGDIVIEPACIMQSMEATAAFRPNSMYKKLLAFINATSNNETVFTQQPGCWPQNSPGPGLHQPNLFIEADLYLILDEIQMTSKNGMLATEAEAFTYGEPLTWRSDAERLNFNLLVWFFKQGNRDMFMRPNLISLDMIQPSIIKRITEANQETIDCGMAMHCKDSGSCWAMSMKHSDKSSCIDEDDATKALYNHANNVLSIWLRLLIGLIVAISILMCICCGCACYFFGFRSPKSDEDLGEPGHDEAAEGDALDTH